MSEATLLRVLDEYRAAVADGAVPPERNPMTYQHADELLRVLRSSGAERQRQIVHEIVLAYLPLAKKHARNWTGKGLPLDDLRQEAVLGLLDAIEHFDSSRGVSYAFVATLWIRTRCQRAIEAAWRHKPRTAEGEAFDRYLFRRSTPARSIEDVVAERELLSIGRAVLSPREQRIVHLRLGGITLAEIAKELDISLQRVAEIEKIAMGKIEAEVHENPGFVRTAADEKRWERAKAAAARSYPVGSESYWRVANYVFHRMKK
jgi:RNA polymerase sigma factor (sigma-70 family)